MDGEVRAPMQTGRVNPARPGPTRRVQARQQPPVAIVPENFKVGWLNGSLRNVSIGGMLVSGAEQLQVGDALSGRSSEG